MINTVGEETAQVQKRIKELKLESGELLTAKSLLCPIMSYRDNNHHYCWREECALWSGYYKTCKLGNG